MVTFVNNALELRLSCTNLLILEVQFCVYFHNEQVKYVAVTR